MKSRLLKWINANAFVASIFIIVFFSIFKVEISFDSDSKDSQNQNQDPSWEYIKLISTTNNTGNFAYVREGLQGLVTCQLYDTSAYLRLKDNTIFVLRESESHAYIFSPGDTFEVKTDWIDNILERGMTYDTLGGYVYIYEKLLSKYKETEL